MKKRFLAIALLLLCLLLAMPAWADSTELLPEDARLNGQEIPADWFGEAWYEGSEDHQIGMDEAQGAVCIRNYIENDARLCYTIKVKSNTYYALSCDIKTENVEGGQGANVSIRDCLAASEPLFGTQDWQRVSLTGKTGKKQKEMTICVRVGGYAALSSGTAWFKNVSLIETEKTADAQDFSPAQAGEAEESAQNEQKTLFGPVLLIALLCGVLMLLFKRFVIERKEQAGERRDAAPLIVVLMAALLLRILLSKIVYGYPVDINCFMAWGNALAQDGFGAFYTGGMFADYPPGYMYVLGLMSKLAQAFGVVYASDVYVLFIKLPAILCDVLSAYVVYRMAQTRFCERTALWLCALMAFNPVMVFLSGGWGQIDCVLTLLFVCALWLFLSEKRIAAGAVYGLAILVKPQALMLGPLLAAAYFLQIKSKRDALRTAAAVLSAFAVILLLAWPFKSTQETGWLLQKYFNTATSYPYASVEAFNLMALLGGNWTDVDKPLLFFSYKTLGTLLIAASVLFSCALYVRAHKRQGALWLCSAYLLCSVFTLGHYMHERYLFPVLLLLLIAFIETKDKRLYTLFALFSVALLLNSLCAFFVTDGRLQRGIEYDVLTYIGSALSVGGWAYFSYAIYQNLIKEKPLAAFTEEAPMDEDATPEAWMRETDVPRPLFTKKDRLLCGTLTLCYAVVALINLGSLKAPENAWRASAGETATIRLEAPAQIGEIWVFGGISEGEASIMLDDGQSFPYEQSFDNMFRWQPLQLGGTTKTLTIRVNRGELWLNEVAIKGAQGELLPGSADISALLDEQESVPEAPSHLNGMYFDELYHGRTAYEHLHGLEPYENSHPPLGKVLIMAGVALFGMNAFGWRIVGCLLGIAMLPILYAFAKRLFKKTEYAFFAAALFACDFMHFTQTRIATIDVYAVFFILLMYDFMYQYISMDFLRDGVKKTLRPLALSGLFFGLGAASKWTCIYAGGGLAVVLLLSLLRRYRESRALLASKDPKLQAMGARYGKDTIKTLLWCCLFFVAVPIAIYLLSYLPYVLSEKHYDLEGIWGVQKFMFSYHSGLTATHPYQSAWWQWPLDLRPMWYYVGYDASGAKAGTISAFGNPAIWWVCSAALLVLIWALVCGKLKANRETDVLVVGAAANYLPWVLVPRCTFIYHYFPMVPFIILAAVYLLKEAEPKYPQLRREKWAWLGVCALLFLLFYPVCSGLMVPTTYIRALEWLPGWTFLGY